MEDDLTEYELQKKLQSLNKKFAKNINASLRGSTDEFVPLVIPAFQHGGRLFVSHPIGAGEGEFEGGNFMDFINKVKDVVSLPLKLATMPLQMIKSAVMGSGECEEDCKPRKPRKSCKGGADAGPVYAKVNKKPMVNLDNAYTDIGKVAPVVLPQLGRVIDEETHVAVKNLKQGLATMPTIQKPTLSAKPQAKGKTIGTGKPRKFRPSGTALGPMARKARAKKGGNLLSTLSDMANIMPSVFGSELDNWIPPEVTRSIAKHIGEKAMGGAKKVRKANPWLEHVKQVKEKHPELKYKDVLVLAKNSYHSAK